MLQAGGGAEGADYRLAYVGTANGMERGIVERESDLPFYPLPAAAVRGRSPLQLLRSGATIARGVGVARRLLQQHRPAAVLGTGGYVCVPLFVAARTLGVPTLIYLPDVVPGLAVRFLALIANQVACNVEDSIEHLRISLYDRSRGKSQPSGGQRIIVTGYPVRTALFDQDRTACRAAFGFNANLPILLVYGGSLGARTINQAVAALLPELLRRAQLIHVCGREGDEEWLRAAAAPLEPHLRSRYRLYPYLDQPHGRAEGGTQAQTDMPSAFGAADLALCRSGASTLAELPAAGLPAILVPLPGVHQEENADYLVRRGAAVKVPNAALDPATNLRNGLLFAMARQLLENHNERRKMAEQSRNLARPDAARNLAGALLRLATRSGG